MKKYFFPLILIFAVVGNFLAVAQEEPSAKEQPATQENRFLFVVETSVAMERAAKAAQQTVRQLIESGVQGEMRAGDSFGIWTFGEKLNASFPMQRWSPGESKNLAESAGDFLKKQRNAKKASLRAGLTPVYSVIKSSRHITVILVSSGTEPIRGTPFDKEINTIYPQYAKDLRDSKIPFVTVLIGHNGRPVAYSVNSSLAIQIPQPPLKPKPAAPVETTNTVAVATNAPMTPVTNALAKVEALAAPVKPEVPSATPNNKSALEIAPVVATSSEPIIAPQISFSTATETTSATENVLPAKSEPDNPAQPEVPVATVPPPSPKTIEAQAKVAHPVQQEISKPAPAAVTNAAVEKPAAVIAPEPVSTLEAEAKSAEVPVAVAQAPSKSSPLKLWSLGGALVLVAIILIYFLMRQSGRSQPSLISHSIDGKK